VFTSDKDQANVMPAKHHAAACCREFRYQRSVPAHQGNESRKYGSAKSTVHKRNKETAV